MKSKKIEDCLSLLGEHKGASVERRLGALAKEDHFPLATTERILRAEEER